MKMNLFLTLQILSVVAFGQKKITSDDLIGDWVRIYNYSADGIDSMMPVTPALGPPSGFSFSRDTVSFYFRGIVEKYDSITGDKVHRN